MNSPQRCLQQKRCGTVLEHEILGVEVGNHD